MSTRDQNQQRWDEEQRSLVARFFDLLYEADKQLNQDSAKKEKPVPAQPSNG